MQISLDLMACRSNQSVVYENHWPIILQQNVTNNGWNMPLTDFLLFCEFLVCWNNEEMLQ